MQFNTFSYCSPKLELRPCPDKKGLGLFAREPIMAGELLAVWGGQVLTGHRCGSCLSSAAFTAFKLKKIFTWYP